MNNPDSFQHVETGYVDNGNTLWVKTTFRGQNAFGAIVLNSVAADVDLDGGVLHMYWPNP